MQGEVNQPSHVIARPVLKLYSQVDLVQCVVEEQSTYLSWEDVRFDT
jgi:hypothetical protein